MSHLGVLARSVGPVEALFFSIGTLLLATSATLVEWTWGGALILGGGIAGLLIILLPRREDYSMLGLSSQVWRRHTNALIVLASVTACALAAVPAYLVGRTFVPLGAIPIVAALSMMAAEARGRSTQEKVSDHGPSPACVLDTGTYGSWRDTVGLPEVMGSAVTRWWLALSPAVLGLALVAMDAITHAIFGGLPWARFSQAAAFFLCVAPVVGYAMGVGPQLRRGFREWVAFGGARARWQINYQGWLTQVYLGSIAAAAMVAGYGTLGVGNWGQEELLIFGLLLLVVPNATNVLIVATFASSTNRQWVISMFLTIAGLMATWLCSQIIKVDLSTFFVVGLWFIAAAIARAVAPRLQYRRNVFGVIAADQRPENLSMGS